MAKAATSTEQAEHSERALGRVVALALPGATLVAAMVASYFSTLGPAILILAAGVLLGTIGLFWASVRTLSGDAPLPVDLEALAARRPGVDNLDEQKNTLLRALKDLELEHSIGKINQADYEQISADYREKIKELMRAMDAEVEPRRARAEKVAQSYLKERGLARNAKGEVARMAPDEPKEAEASSPTDAPPARLACRKCETSNEPDAAFCKKCGTALRPSKEEAPDASV